MIENQVHSETHVFYKRFSSHSKGVGIAWAILTLCFLIINIIVFHEPQWIGDSWRSDGRGWMGLYQYCDLYNAGTAVLCRGRFQDFNTILTPAFKASTFFIGVSILIIFVVILLFFIFFFKKALKLGYIICGCLQMLSALFMFLGNVIYPAGWNHVQVIRLCGDDTWKYQLGKCTFRWAYMLSIVAMFCIFMIAILAFVLSSRTPGKMRNLEEKCTGTSTRANSVMAGSVVNPNYNSNTINRSMHS